MKRKVQIYTIVIGVIVAFFALSSVQAKQTSQENKTIEQISFDTQEAIQLVSEIFEKSDVEKPSSRLIKIYNKEYRLVYESRYADDERIKFFLRRSDLVLLTDSSSYYLLGD